MSYILLVNPQILAIAGVCAALIRAVAHGQRAAALFALRPPPFHRSERAQQPYPNTSPPNSHTFP